MVDRYEPGHRDYELIKKKYNTLACKYKKLSEEHKKLVRVLKSVNARENKWDTFIGMIESEIVKTD